MPSYDASPRFKVKLQCRVCAHKYTRILRSLDETDPPCPRCETAQRAPRGLKFNGTAPSVGGSNVVRAYDFAQNEAARQTGATNLRTPSRRGDTSAPIIAPAQQAAADAMFRRSPARQPSSAEAARIAATTAAVNTGAFAKNPDAQFVSSVLSKRIRPNIHIINQPNVSRQR